MLDRRWGGEVKVMDRTAGIHISGESKFRELEDEYLQKQARIWLTEVLTRRLDEDQTISDILANGDLLFDVSYVLWKMLIEKGVEVDDLRIFSRTRKSRKHSGKYTPYSNVDAFLKICKLMGLNGVDLFSPSDVVERRDNRKVCLCLRSLSKKARTMDINVPDFDIVTCTITMPTNLIGCIRRSLEFSQCGSVTSESYNSCIDSDPPSIKTKSTASLESSYTCHSEESDDADSSVSVGYYRPSSKILSNAGLVRKSGSSSSLESFSLSKNTNLEKALAHFGVCNHMDKHELISSPLVDSSESVVDISAVSCFINQQNQADSQCHGGNPTEIHHNSDQTVHPDGAHDLSVCPSRIELFVDKITPSTPKTDRSLPVSGLECHGYCFSCGEAKDQSNYADMLYEGPLSFQMPDEGLLCYNLVCPRNSCSQHANVHNFNLDDNEDDEGLVELQFGSVLDPVPDLPNTSGKVHKNSCDAGCTLIDYSDRLEPKMNCEETVIHASCHDYQYYANGRGNEISDGNVHLSFQMTSDYGDCEAESLYELEDWSADNEDLENVHLSIIERFLTTTVCSKPEQRFCNEKCDESDCWNLDDDFNDVDLKHIPPISSCEQLLHFVDGSSSDGKFVEDLSHVAGDEDKGVIGFPNREHQANFVEGTKQTTYGTESPCEQEACDKVLIQCSAIDSEFDAGKSPLSHIPLERFDADRDEVECLEAKLIEAEGLVPEDHETANLNQSTTGKSPILKSVMGGAAVLGLGVLAFFLNTRIAEKPKSKNLDSEPSHISGKKKLSSQTSNNGGAKKGVYAAGKLKFS